MRCAVSGFAEGAVELPKLEPRISSFAATPALLHFGLRLRPVLPASASELQASALDGGHAPSYYH